MKRWRSAGMAAGGLAVVAVLALTDAALGRELGLSLFYAVPVFYVARRAGGIWGGIVALGAAIAWTAADSWGGTTYREEWIRYWNGATRLGFFGLAVAVARMRSGLEREAWRARRDELTGLLNRRGLIEAAQRETERARRFKRPLTLAYLDCDGFKSVNDSLGHDAGDRLLRLAAAEMRKKLRQIDVAGRVGGDEFVLVLPEADALTARVVLERVVKAVSAVLESHGLSATFSAGAVVCSGIPGSIDEMLRQADSAMYRAKQRGPGGIELERFDPTTAAASPSEPVTAGRHA